MLIGLFLVGDYRYGFQGQEKDDEVKGEGNSINYKYRMHDPRIGRFFAVDPLAADYPHNSPYAFSENRLLDGVELEGLEFQNKILDQAFRGTFGETAQQASFGIMQGSNDIKEGIQSLSTIEPYMNMLAMSQSTNSTMALDRAFGTDLTFRNLTISKNAVDGVQDMPNWGVREWSRFGTNVIGELVLSKGTGALGLGLAKRTSSLINTTSKANSFTPNSKLWSDINKANIEFKLGQQAKNTGGLKSFAGTEKAWSTGATPNSIYTYLSGDKKFAVSNYIYNSEGKVSFQVDFDKHGKYPSGHGHKMSIPGDLGSGHGGKHIGQSQIPSEYFRIPKNVEFSQPIGQ